MLYHYQLHIPFDFHGWLWACEEWCVLWWRCQWGHSLADLWLTAADSRSLAGACQSARTRSKCAPLLQWVWSSGGKRPAQWSCSASCDIYAICANCHHYKCLSKLAIIVYWLFWFFRWWGIIRIFIFSPPVIELKQYTVETDTNGTNKNIPYFNDY